MHDAFELKNTFGEVAKNINYHEHFFPNQITAKRFAFSPTFLAAAEAGAAFILATAARAGLTIGSAGALYDVTTMAANPKNMNDNFIFTKEKKEMSATKKNESCLYAVKFCFCLRNRCLETLLLSIDFYAIAS